MTTSCVAFRRNRNCLPRSIILISRGFVDRGMTEDGLHLVMEFIEGERVDRYCDERKLPPRECAKLLLSICDAVAFVHRHGALHRDSFACEYCRHS